MSTAVAPRVKRYMPEDLLRTPNGKYCELVDGRMLEKPMGAESDWIGARLTRVLGNHVEEHQAGEVFGPTTGYQCFPDDRRKVRKPDISFIAKGKLPGGAIPKGHMKVTPDLAVEVISPGDTYASVEGKIEDYLRAGIPLIWVFTPENRTVKVYADGDARPLVLREQDQLTGGRVLPGFTCVVGDLFLRR